MRTEVEFIPEMKAHFNARAIGGLEYCISTMRIERPIVIRDGRIWGYEKEVLDER